MEERDDGAGDRPGTGGGSPQPVVAFDFDGTITSRDTFRYFLAKITTNSALAASLLRIAPQLAKGARGGAARDEAKRALCRQVLTGLHRVEAEGAAATAAEEIVRSLIRPDSAARIRWHQAEGHRIIVVSASFESYVRPVVAELGIDEVIATRWGIDPESNLLTGELDGPNVRSDAKVALLEAHLGGPCELAYAYGNSGGDAAMLARAEHRIWVGRRPIPAPDADAPA